MKAKGEVEPRRGYHPSETAEVRARTVSEIVLAQEELLTKNPDRTPLADTEAVQKVAYTVMRRCAEAGALPNFEILAAALGVSRRALYDFCDRNPDSATAQFIDRIRTAWAGARQMAADRGAVDTTMSIFILLNSSLGFNNNHTVELKQADSPMTALPDTESARNRIVEAVAVDDE